MTSSFTVVVVAAVGGADWTGSGSGGSGPGPAVSDPAVVAESCEGVEMMLGICRYGDCSSGLPPLGLETPSVTDGSRDSFEGCLWLDVEK